MDDLVTSDLVLAEHAASIRSLTDRAGRDTVEIGRLLTAAKDRLPHGAFGPWLDREFGWTDRTAQKLMRIAEVFGGKAEVASVLGTETLYALATDATPEDVRAAFVARAEAGGSVTLRDVRAAVKDARMLATVDLDTGEIVEDVEREAPDLMPGLARQDFDLREARRLMRERAEAASTRVLSALPDDGGARARADLRAAFWTAAVATRRQLLSLDPELVAESLAPEDEARARELTGDIARWVDTATSGFGRGLRVIGGGS